MSCGSSRKSKGHCPEKTDERVVLLALLSVPECREKLAQETQHWDRPIPATGALTLDQIAAYVGASREWVRRAERSGLVKLAMSEDMQKLNKRNQL